MKALFLLPLSFLVLAANGGEELAVPSSNALLIARFYHAGQTSDVMRVMRTSPPNDPDVMFVAARLFLEQHQPQIAFDLLQEVARLRPSDYRPLFLMGVEMTKSGGRNRAVVLLRESLKRNPMHAPSWLWLADATISNEERLAALHYVLLLEDRDSPTAKEAIRKLDGLGESTRQPEGQTNAVSKVGVQR